MRAGSAGFVHQAALHSFVLHAGQASFGKPGRLFSLARRHELRLLLRYPVRWRQLRRFAADPGTALGPGHAADPPDPGCGMIARTGQPVTERPAPELPTRSSEDIHG